MLQLENIVEHRICKKRWCIERRKSSNTSNCAKCNVKNDLECSQRKQLNSLLNCFWNAEEQTSEKYRLFPLFRSKHNMKKMKKQNSFVNGRDSHNYKSANCILFIRKSIHYLSCSNCHELYEQEGNLSKLTRLHIQIHLYREKDKEHIQA